jgi:hypothetical protein
MSSRSRAGCSWADGVDGHGDGIGWFGSGEHGVVIHVASHLKGTSAASLLRDGSPTNPASAITMLLFHAVVPDPSAFDRPHQHVAQRGLGQAHSETVATGRRGRVEDGLTTFSGMRRTNPALARH